MADQRRGGIAWTEETLNPIRARHRATGKIGWYCQRVSDGCKHCYAATMNEWRGNGVDYTVPALKDVELFLDAKILDAPLRWRRPRRVFLCSMTDLFADFVPDEWIDRIFAVMALCPQHTFQVLTKRPERLQAFFKDGWEGVFYGYEDTPEYRRVAHDGNSGNKEWSQEAADRVSAARRTIDGSPLPNVWLGVSVESRDYLGRLDLLCRVPAAVRFVSFEPLLEDLGDVDLAGINQAIYGGEAGPKARPCDLAWIRRGIACCQRSGTAAFVKQLGAHPHNEAPSGRMFCWCARGLNDCGAGSWSRSLVLRDRKGGDWSEWPEDLRVREFPRDV